MGQLQLTRLDHQLAEIEEIEVDGAGNISRVGARSSEHFFDRRQSAQQFLRLPGISKFDNGVQEFRRAFFATDWIGFVNGRGAKWRKDAAECRDILARIAQVREPLTEIRTKRDARSHCISCSGRRVACKTLKDAADTAAATGPRHLPCCKGQAVCRRSSARPATRPTQM